LKSRYPYGLIGDDYGLLFLEDMAVNTCNVDVTPFSKEKNLAYSYWQCFLIKNTKISCEHTEKEPSEPYDTGYLGISARNSNGIQSYLARNAIKMTDCQKRLRAWNKITFGEKYVCLSGSYAMSDNATDGTAETDWVLDKFKTHKGCESFGLGCDFKKPFFGTCIPP
jgi:hypothetical protein